jgi:hypothetical protein
MRMQFQSREIWDLLPTIENKMLLVGGADDKLVPSVNLRVMAPRLRCVLKALYLPFTGCHKESQPDLESILPQCLQGRPAGDVCWYTSWSAVPRHEEVLAAGRWVPQWS